MPGWDDSNTLSKTCSTAALRLHSSSGLSSVTVCKQCAAATNNKEKDISFEKSTNTLVAEQTELFWKGSQIYSYWPRRFDI